jgi:hypothetical protein
VSLTQRKKRPLKRDSQCLRDDRLFLVACDDTYAPRLYFDFFRIPRIQVHVIETPAEDTSSHASHVLERLKAFDHDEDDELWMLLDTDHCTAKGHQKNFNRALKEAKEQGVKIAVSRPCFELWLLLHHVDVKKVVSLKDAKEAETKLREILGEYNKANLKQEHYPIKKVCDAYQRAEELDQQVAGGKIPDSNTSRVYLLLNAILSKSIASQLPVEFQTLLQTIQPSPFFTES